MARCAVPVAERSVRRRNEPPSATKISDDSFRPLNAAGDSAARGPYHFCSEPTSEFGLNCLPEPADFLYASLSLDECVAQKGRP